MDLGGDSAGDLPSSDVVNLVHSGGTRHDDMLNSLPEEAEAGTPMQFKVRRLRVQLAMALGAV